MGSHPPQLKHLRPFPGCVRQVPPSPPPPLSAPAFSAERFSRAVLGLISRWYFVFE